MISSVPVIQLSAKHHFHLKHSPSAVNLLIVNVLRFRGDRKVVANNEAILRASAINQEYWCQISSENKEHQTYFECNDAATATELDLVDSFPSENFEHQSYFECNDAATAITQDLVDSFLSEKWEHQTYFECNDAADEQDLVDSFPSENFDQSYFDCNNENAAIVGGFIHTPSPVSESGNEIVSNFNIPPSSNDHLDIDCTIPSSSAMIVHESFLSPTSVEEFLSLSDEVVNNKKKRKPKQSLVDKMRIAEESKRKKYEVKNPCSCKKQCSEKITHTRRIEINKNFLRLGFEAQKLYIRAQSTTTTPSTVNRSKPPSRLVHNYFFNNENGQKWEVCQQFFISTLGFKQNNNTVVRNALDQEFPNGDGRGKHSNRFKFDETIVVDHIMGFHPNSSHYRREHAPFRLYLPSDVTIVAMHKLFVETQPVKPCSYEYYRKIVDKLNISFTKLGHEKCEECEKFLQHKHCLGIDSSNCDICIQNERHRQFYTKARIEYDADKKVADSPKHIVVSADQEKVIMLPRMEQFKEVIFTKRVCVFNETFAPVGSRSIFPVFAALWHEGIAGRKKEELISTYHSFLLFFRNATTITIWCDNCTAQNKNWALFSFLVYMINSKEIAAESITMKFLEKGHTFMSADSFHHQVELAMKSYEGGVCDFDDFVKCVQSANGSRVVAKQLQITDFSDWSDWTSQAKLNNSNPRPYIAEFSKLKFVRGKKTMFYANNFDDKWTELDFIMNKHQGLIRSEPRSMDCGISREVKDGIIRKIVPLMPANRRNFWYSIPTPSDTLL